MSPRSGSPAVSLPQALRRGGDVRYLTVFVLGILLASMPLYLPVAAFFQTLFDHSTRAKDLVRAWDSSSFIEVMRQMNEPVGEGLGAGLRGAALTGALIAPALAAAAVAVARRGGTGGFRSLLAAMGEWYPRMLRLAVASAVPLGVVGAIAAGMFRFASKAGSRAVQESTASHWTLAAGVVTAVLVWFADVTVEAGRAHFAAEPERRSALAAWWSGVGLTARRPAAVLGLSLATTLLGVGGATVLTAIRLRIAQTGAASIALAFVLAQLAVVALAWGRASRLVGLAGMVRDERDEREGGSGG